MDTSGRKKNLVILCGNIKTPFVRASGFSRGFTKLQTYKLLHWRSRGPSFVICTRRLIVEMSCLPSAIPFVPPHTSTLCTCGFCWQWSCPADSNAELSALKRSAQVREGEEHR
jgi:hypothetical protein